MSNSIELIGQNSSNVTSKVYVDTSNNLQVKDSQLAAVISGSELQVDVISSALPSGAATESTVSTLNGKVTACNTGAVVVSSSALPTGGATSALQTSGNASLTTLAGCVSGTTMTVSAGAVSTTATTLKGGVSVADGATETTSGVDAGASLNVSFFGNLSDTTGNIVIEVSSDDSAYYDIGENIYVDGTGNFYKNFNGIGARYIRLKYTNGSGGAKTWTAIASVKA